MFFDYLNTLPPELAHHGLKLNPFSMPNTPDAWQARDRRRVEFGSMLPAGIPAGVGRVA